MIDAALAQRRGIDLDDPKLGLTIAAERLSTVRYVFLVQIEDGIASASQRAALEYADAVLLGWPDGDGGQVRDIDEAERAKIKLQISSMEVYIAQFSSMEREADTGSMADRLIRICECVAEVRKLYQPSFPLPTFAEIRRVVQEEWDADMGSIDAKETNPTAQTIEAQTMEAQTEHANEIQEQLVERHGRDSSGELPVQNARDNGAHA